MGVRWSFASLASFTLAAGCPYPDPDSIITQHTPLFVAPATHDFGQMRLSTGASTTFLVGNRGAGPSGPIRLDLQGASADSGEFQLPGRNTCAGATLLPDATCLFELIFAPQTAGPKSATVVVLAGELTLTSAAVSGESIEGLPIDIMPAAHDLGAVLRGEIPTAAFTVVNPDQERTGPLSVQLIGSDAPDFSLKANPCFRAGVGATSEGCLIEVQFRPSTLGGKQVAVQVSASPGGTATATLTAFNLLGGVCLIRDSMMPPPSASEPDVGRGYAKNVIPGVNSVEALAERCSADMMRQLQERYCAANPTAPSATSEVLTFGAGGRPALSDCRPFGCERLSCP
jgi:hypothetical protein